MRRTSLSLILALAVLAGACSSDDGPSVATLDQMRVVKVSGDQSSPVPSAPSQAIYATAGASLQLLDADGYTAEPLVAQVVVEGGSMGIMSGGPIIPKGTLIHWQIPSAAGRLLGTPTATDDTAYVINRWAPGTRAGTYTVKGQTLRGDGSIVTEATWDLVVEPGPPHALVGWQVPGRYPTTGSTAAGCVDCFVVLHVGDTLDFHEWWREDGPWVEDEYGNEIGLAWFLAEHLPQLEIRHGDFAGESESTQVDLDGWTWVVSDSMPDAWSLIVHIGPLSASTWVEIRPAP